MSRKANMFPTRVKQKSETPKCSFDAQGISSPVHLPKPTSKFCLLPGKPNELSPGTPTTRMTLKKHVLCHACYYCAFTDNFFSSHHIHSPIKYDLLCAESWLSLARSLARSRALCLSLKAWSTLSPICGEREKKLCVNVLRRQRSFLREPLEGLCLLITFCHLPYPHRTRAIRAVPVTEFRAD